VESKKNTKSRFSKISEFKLLAHLKFIIVALKGADQKETNSHEMHKIQEYNGHLPYDMLTRCQAFISLLVKLFFTCFIWYLVFFIE